MKLHSNLRLFSNGFDVTIPALGENKRYRAYLADGNRTMYVGTFNNNNDDETIDYGSAIPSYEMAIIAALLYVHFDIVLPAK